MHVVARCNNREFYFAAQEDFEVLLDHLGEMSSAYEVRLFVRVGGDVVPLIPLLRQHERVANSIGHPIQLTSFPFQIFLRRDQGRP